MKEEKQGFWKDFKAFIARGNVADMAVGIVVGTAFTAIVNSLAVSYTHLWRKRLPPARPFPKTASWRF